MENYFLCDRPDDLLVLDTKAGTDLNVGNDRFKTIDHPSKPDVLVRLVKVYEDKNADMTAFKVNLRDQNGDQDMFQLHRWSTSTLNIMDADGDPCESTLSLKMERALKTSLGSNTTWGIPRKAFKQ
mgnify:CR=1 FL=1